MAQNPAGYLYTSNVLRIKGSTTVSSTADITAVDVSGFNTGNGITLIFDCSAVAGAGSLAIVIKGSDDNSSFTAITGATITVAAAGVSLLFIPNFVGKYLQLSQTLTGTSVTYSCIAYGIPEATTTSEGYTTSPVGQSAL